MMARCKCTLLCGLSPAGSVCEERPGDALHAVDALHLQPDRSRHLTSLYFVSSVQGSFSRLDLKVLNTMHESMRFLKQIVQLDVHHS